MIVDCHAHAIPPEAVDLLDQTGVSGLSAPTAS
jgi:hypothetical protein